MLFQKVSVNRDRLLLTACCGAPLLSDLDAVLTQKNQLTVQSSGFVTRGTMSGGSAIDAATKRLALALDALEAALERRRESDRGEETLAAQLQALGSDRSRLAADLDAQAARASQLESTNREVARRLDVAIDTIRSVIEASDH